MDQQTISRYFEERLPVVDNSINLQEYAVMEDKKTDLFYKKVDFLCMAESLKIAMVKETSCKQLKRYFKTYCGMEEERETQFSNI